MPLTLLDREPPTARCGEREPTPSSGVGSTPRSGKWESKGWEGRGKEGVTLDLNTTNSLCSCDFRSLGGVVCRVSYAVKAALTLSIRWVLIALLKIHKN